MVLFLHVLDEPFFVNKFLATHALVCCKWVFFGGFERLGPQIIVLLFESLSFAHDMLLKFIECFEKPVT